MKQRINNQGFTIIELLIATVVFSVVLLLLTGTIIQFNKLYYKGTVDTKTRETSRTITEDITRNIQFAAGSSVGLMPGISGNGYICAGNYVYRYRKMQLVNTASGTLRRYEQTTCSDPGLSGGTELLGNNMYLQDIALTGSGPYVLTVSVGYGKPFGAPDSDHNANGTCKYAIRLGGAFCSLNTLTVTVTQRL